MHLPLQVDIYAHSMHSRTIVGTNWYFEENDLQDKAFDPARTEERLILLRKFRTWLEARGIEMHTWDMVDFKDPAVKYVIFFDWCRYHDKRFGRRLRQIPFPKRILVMIEPGTMNIQLHYFPFYRRLFSTVFTFHQALLDRHPEYIPINNPMFGADGEALAYFNRADFQVPYSQRKLLVAVASHRWSLHPRANFSRRERVFAFFDEHLPGDFELWGRYWNRPLSILERAFGVRHFFRTYKGELPLSVEAKLRLYTRYRFCLCLENDTCDPGFITDRITDPFCSRCVPVYWGPKSITRYVPPECFINYRDFKGPKELASFLTSVSEEQYAGYVTAMEKFLRSDQRRFFTTDYMFDIIYRHLFEPSRILKTQMKATP